MKTRIYYHHTDAGGVVYYANYLKFLEEARTELLESKGLLMKDLIERGVLFVVAHQEIDYKMPARYGDVLESRAQVVNMGAARIEFQQDIANQDGQLVTKAKTTLVCIDKNFKPQQIPEDIKKKLEG